MKFQSAAIIALHESAEAYLVTQFEDFAIHAKRVTDESESREMYKENSSRKKKSTSKELNNEEGRRLLVDVGQDLELEQFLDQSVVPFHLGGKAPSSESEEDVRGRPRVASKRRYLFSDTFLDSAAEESDMFALSPIKKNQLSMN